jgi:phage protein D
MILVQPKPAFTILLDGRDLTSKIRPRLNMLVIRESRGDNADELDLTLDDSDGKLAIPSRGAILSVHLGWEDSGTVDKGTYTVNEIEHRGSPDVIQLRARSASMTKAMGERKEKSWHGVSIATIVKTIAGIHSLKPACSATLGAIVIGHIDQTNESDMSFLTRLAKRYDAVMNVKNGNLLFLPIGEGATLSGKELPTIELTRQDGDWHRYHVSERENYAGVKATYHSSGAAKHKSVIVGGENSTSIKVLPETYPNEAEARAAATAEYKRTQRSQATMSYNLAFGRPDVHPESPIYLDGFKDEINALSWLAKEVTHTVTDGGYVTALELETRDDPTSSRHRAHFRRGANK